MASVTWDDVPRELVEVAAQGIARQLGRDVVVSWDTEYALAALVAIVDAGFQIIPASPESGAQIE